MKQQEQQDVEESNNGVHANGNAGSLSTKQSLKSNGVANNGATAACEETNSTTYPGASVKVKQNGTMVFKKGAAALCNGESHVAEFEGNGFTPSPNGNVSNGYNLRH